MKKYEFTEEIIEWEGHVLHKIRAVRSFGDVQKGDLGGYIEYEENLSHEKNAWVSDNACVLGNAIVSDNAIAMDDAIVCDNAEVSGHAEVLDNAIISSSAEVLDNAIVSGTAIVLGHARVLGNAIISKPSDVLTIGLCGIQNDFTTFFHDKDQEISVSCGCFSGKIDEFEKRVNETYGDSKYGREYKAAIELAKIHIMEE